MVRRKKKKNRKQRAKARRDAQAVVDQRLLAGADTMVRIQRDLDKLAMSKPVMETGREDAKTVFERLKVMAGLGSDDVTKGEFPKQEDILAELRYDFDGTEWAAVVTLDTNDDGSPCFRLWYQQGDRYQRSGQFPDGQRLAGYIRQAAGEKFKTRPVVDTLDKLKFRHAASAVPDCYRTAGRTQKCSSCPYRGDCFAEVDDKVNWVVDEPGLEPSEDKPVPEPPEPESVFMRRLRQKVADQWAAREEEQSRIRYDDPEADFCSGCGGTGQQLLTDAATNEVVRMECGLCHGTGKKAGV